MGINENTSVKSRIVPRPGAVVKAQIVAAGLPLGRIATAAKISSPALSNLLAGRRRRRHEQVLVWDAFRRLSRQDVALEQFWGELLAS